MPWLDKHTFPRVTRSTLNELPQNHHEKASLVCVSVQSPSGLALVPCALSMVDQSGQLRCWITQINKQINISGTEKCFVFCFWHPMLVRPAMKRLFCLKAKNGLGRFAPSALPHYKYRALYCCTTTFGSCYVFHSYIQITLSGNVSNSSALNTSISVSLYFRPD